MAYLLQDEFTSLQPSLWSFFTGGAPAFTINPASNLRGIYTNLTNSSTAFYSLNFKSIDQFSGTIVVEGSIRSTVGSNIARRVDIPLRVTAWGNSSTVRTSFTALETDMGFTGIVLTLDTPTGTNTSVTTIGVRSFTSGTPTTLVSQTSTGIQSGNAYLRFKVRLSATSVSIKYWNATGTEPTSYQIVTSITAGVVPSSGYVGGAFLGSLFGGTIHYIDYLRVSESGTQGTCYVFTNEGWVLAKGYSGIDWTQGEGNARVWDGTAWNFA